MDQPNVVTKPREPWNKGKLVGQKAPFKLKEIWATAYGCNWPIAPGTLPYSTWPSTASYGPVIW